MRLVRNRRVGLVTNQTGVDAQGISDVTRLRDAGIRLVALFSPEHGFQGAADPGALVASSKDSATGLPIYSLYGRSSAPSDEMLQGIDVILVDLQDAGARYYTYLATTIEVMQAAARRQLPVLVLDRPNPIGGLVQGNVLDPAFSSKVGSLAVPMRHGLSLGELARLAAGDLQIRVDLRVIPVAGWRRDQALDQTGLPFIPPSPNLRSLESLFHYPGTCLFEGTNLSVGRGSDAPFEQVGAPWLDTTRVLTAIRAAALPGVRFHGVQFTPRKPGDGKYADTSLAGIRLEVTDRPSYDPTATAVHLLSVIRAVHREQFKWIPAHFDRLAGGPTLREQIELGVSAGEIVESWSGGVEQFRKRRVAALLYR
ncbi:MAG: exo-beta-N-acetylmuramidase NamZ domain-containing protein [Gemmatimonadales bacterium]